MQSTPSVPLLSGLFWPDVVAPDKVLSIGQIELFGIQTEGKQMTSVKMIVWNRTVFTFNSV